MIEKLSMLWSAILGVLCLVVGLVPFAGRESLLYLGIGFLLLDSAIGRLK